MRDDEGVNSNFMPPHPCMQDAIENPDARDHARSNPATQRINVLDGLSQRAQSRDTRAHLSLRPQPSDTRSVWMGSVNAPNLATQRINVLDELRMSRHLRALKSMSLAPQRGQSGYLVVNALNLDGGNHHRQPTVTLAERQKSSTAARAAVTFAEIGRRRQEKQRRATESLLLRTAEREMEEEDELHPHGGSAATVERVAASESAPAGAATVTEESMEQQLQFLKQQQLQFERACMEAQGISSEEQLARACIGRAVLHALRDFQPGCR